LPVDLWIYRDAVILGQCLSVGSLERRVEAVRGVQKVLGISEGLARLVAEDVARGRHLFGALRLVAQARRDPVGLLVRLGQRVRRYGGHLGRHGTVVIAVATLLGARKEDLRQAIVRLSESAGKQVLRRRRVRVRLMRRWIRRAAGPLWDVAVERPEVIVIGLAVVFGLAALVLALLVAGGVWVPWNEEIQPDVTPAVKTPAESPGVQSQSPSSGQPGLGRGKPGRSTTLPGASPRSDNVDPEWLREFRQKYPAVKPAGRPDAKAEADESDEPKPATTFFKVPALRAKPPANGGAGKTPSTSPSQ